MSNPRKIPNPEATSDDPFARLFAKVEKSPRYWEELARLEFTEKILARMSELSVNRTELAERLDVQPSLVTRLLSGQNNFEMGTMVRIARALNCDFRSHLQPAGTETMWINVLKEEPVRPAQDAGWDHGRFRIIKPTKNTTAPDESLPVAA